MLWPPDGLNLKQGTNGELFGYGYLPLPLTAPKKTTAGNDVPTGNQCWTLFLNTRNFKGTVTFFVPYFWSKPTVEKPDMGGLFLDTRPSDPNKAVQMETQHVPAYIAKDAKVDTYARVAPTQFPAKAGDAPLIDRITAYNRAALWDGVDAWFNGGKEVPGRIDPKASVVQTFKGGGGSIRHVAPPNTERDSRSPLAWGSFATPTALDETTCGYKWGAAVTKVDRLVTLPEYYLLEVDAKGKERWAVVNATEVPAETGLAKAVFLRRRAAKSQPT